jgi:DNA-binding PadR family transcriptional regulator
MLRAPALRHYSIVIRYIEERYMPTESPGNLIPLMPSAFHILLAVTDSEMHGYAIMQEVERLTGGKLKLGPGTLYGAIKRLLADSLIEESDEGPDLELDDERRYYRLTNRGERVASAEAQRLESAVRRARKKRLLTGRALAHRGAGL